LDIGYVKLEEFDIGNIELEEALDIGDVMSEEVLNVGGSGCVEL
jgi:hypothetical protein